MSWTKDDVRDEMDEQEEEEVLWIDKKGKIVESAFCAYFLQKRPLMCLDQKLFDLDGEVNEDRLRHEIHQEIRSAARNDTAKKTKRIVEAIKMETYQEEWDVQLDRIHLKNGTYYLDERGFVPKKELCLNRFPVEYQPDAPAPETWLDFLNGLLMPEDIPTLQEYLGYLMIPSTKAQKMMILTGRGGQVPDRTGDQKADGGFRSDGVHPPAGNQPLRQRQPGTQAGDGGRRFADDSLARHSERQTHRHRRGQDLH